MFRLILTFFLIYLIFRILTAYVFPWLVNWYLRRYKEKFFRNNPWHQQRRQEKDVHITGEPPKSTKGDLGEYVDFEEIKEDKEKQKGKK